MLLLFPITVLGPYQKSTARLHYFGGPVMSAPRTYVIFWLPSHYRFEPAGDDARFERLIERYLRDVGNTRFYNLLTQYSYNVPGSHAMGQLVLNGPIRNESTYGGSYRDSSPYPREASSRDPLRDSDFLSEVLRVAGHERWPTDLGALYLVFTGAGAQVCFASYGCRSRDACAWHDGFDQGPVFAFIGDPASRNDCTLPRSPNKDVLADSAINLMSHEQFEAVTDPVPCSGWITGCTDSGDEIGDLCADQLGSIRSDGGNVLLHGHSYLVQEEWSNRDARCVIGSSIHTHAPRSAGLPTSIVLWVAVGLALWIVGATAIIVLLQTVARRLKRPSRSS